jgi:NADH dehydrogenase
VFGRGANPINFVSIADVAAVVEHAVIDPTTRGRILEIGGPDNLTFDHIAQALQTTAGRTERPKHVPPPMLHLMANSLGRVKPQLGRQARAALVMDRADLRFDSGPLHQQYQDLPCTALADVLARDHGKQLA